MKRDMKVACVCVCVCVCVCACVCARLCVKWSIQGDRLTFELCLERLSAASYSLSAGSSNQNHDTKTASSTHTYRHTHRNVLVSTYLEFSICLVRHFLCILTYDCDNVQMTWIYAARVILAGVCVTCISISISECVCVWHCVRALHLDSVLTQWLEGSWYVLGLAPPCIYCSN